MHAAINRSVPRRSKPTVPRHRLWAGSVATLGLTAMLAGCPARPDNEDHQDAVNEECIECHFGGDEDAPSPPQDHWDGDTAATWHDACTHCHR